MLCSLRRISWVQISLTPMTRVPHPPSASHLRHLFEPPKRPAYSHSFDTFCRENLFTTVSDSRTIKVFFREASMTLTAIFSLVMQLAPGSGPTTLRRVN